MTGHDLDVYDVAFLAGGPDRVVDTAIVTLVRRGGLRVHRPGQLATADLVRRHPVEAAVLDAVGPTGHRSVDMIRWRLVGDERILDIGRRLHDRGMAGRGLSGRRGSYHATRAGRRVLAEIGDLPGADTEAMRVAQGGRAGMTSKTLRADIFEPPGTTPVIPRSRRPFRRLTPEEAAYRAEYHGVAGGIAMGGAVDAGGGGFDAGGGGGGDGGGGF